MTYVLLFIFGFIGLVVMALLGSLKTGGHHAARLGARGSHGLPHGHVAHPAPLVPGGKGIHLPKAGHHANAGARGAGKLSSKAAWLLPGLSPIDLMAMAMGSGAMGIVGRKVFHNELTAAILAVAGAILIDILIVRPLFGLLLRFASEPSSGLEGMISQLAEAATGFDANGRGLIRLTFDGQTTQVLASLDSDELASGIKVKKGDSLVVLEVDPTRNVCRVSREIASSD